MSYEAELVREELSLHDFQRIDAALAFSITELERSAGDPTSIMHLQELKNRFVKAHTGWLETD